MRIIHIHLSSRVIAQRPPIHTHRTRATVLVAPSIAVYVPLTDEHGYTHTPPPPRARDTYRAYIPPDVLALRDEELGLGTHRLRVCVCMHFYVTRESHIQHHMSSV